MSRREAEQRGRGAETIACWYLRMHGWRILSRRARVPGGEVDIVARHKKILIQSKGYRGRRKNVFRVAKQAVMKAGQYAYRDRRVRKREFRALWITRINAAARLRWNHRVGAEGSKPLASGAGNAPTQPSGC